MTDNPGTDPHAETSPEDRAALIGQAIEVLTAIARQTRVRGAGTPAAQVEPIDFADTAAHVLTAVAANIGSVDTLLAGRPGSWEADLVRRLVDGTAGEDGGLVLWRTAPIRLPFHADNVFFDFGINDLFDGEDARALSDADDDDLTDGQRNDAEELAAAIETLLEQDQAAYTEAYGVTAQRYLTELGATCTVEIVAEDAAGDWDGLAERIDEYARQHTPLPMTGSAPDWSEGTPADALRRAGLTYTARATAR